MTMPDFVRKWFPHRNVQPKPAPEETVQDDRMQAVQLMPGEHHWRHGITFKRLQQRLDPSAPGNGDVQLCVGGLVFRIPAVEWVSIICEVSDGRSYEAAQRFHLTPNPARDVPQGELGDKVGG